MSWSSTNVPDAAKNLSKPDKKKFAEIANAILAETKDEGKAISIALAQLKKEQDEPMRYVEATIYQSELYKDINDNEYFTVCRACNKPQKIKKSDGYCEDCNEPLMDSYGDGITPEDIEKLALSYMKSIHERITSLEKMTKSLILGKEIDLMEYVSASKSNVGLGHSLFSYDNGYLASSYIKKEEFEAFDNKYEKAIWKGGFVVNPEIFEKIKNEELTGFSFGGNGFREIITEDIEE